MKSIKMKKILQVILSTFFLVITLSPLRGEEGFLQNESEVDSHRMSKAEPERGLVLSLEQCIDSALTNNISLQQQVLNRASSQISYKQSWTNLSPEINGSASQNWSFGRSTGADNVITSRNSSSTSFGLSGSLTLFDGLAMKFAIDEARATLQASEANIAASALQIRLNISSMYLKVLLDKELVQVAEEQLASTRFTLHRDSLLVAQQRLAAGELYAILAQEANEQLTLTQAENNLRLDLLDLAQAMNMQEVENFDIITIPLDELEAITHLPSRDDARHTALSNRPEIQAAEHSIRAQEAILKQRYAAYSPTLSAYANMGSTYYNVQGASNASFAAQMSQNFQGSVGLSLSVPIYNKMRTPYAVSRQQIAIDNARLELAQQKQTITKQIDQAYYNALNAATEANAATRSVQNTEEALRYADQKYQAGRATSYEFTTAKTAYTKALSTALQARYTYLFRLKILEYYIGK